MSQVTKLVNDRLGAETPEPQAHALSTALHAPLEAPLTWDRGQEKKPRHLMISQGQLRQSPGRWAPCEPQPSLGMGRP